MALEDYLRPVDTAVRTTFLTSRAAGRRMVRQGAGVILAFGGSGDPPRDYYLGGLQAVRDPADRRGARDDPARRRGDGGGRRRHRAPDHAGAAARLEDAGNVAAFVASDRPTP